MAGLINTLDLYRAGGCPGRWNLRLLLISILVFFINSALWGLDAKLIVRTGPNPQTPVPQHFQLPIINVDSLPDLSAFYRYIAQHIKYPSDARATQKQGFVIAEFQLDNAGSISTLSILRDMGGGCGDEVRRVIADVPSTVVSQLAKSGSNKFILAFKFGLGKPFEGTPDYPESDATRLPPVTVTGHAIERR